MSMKNGSIIRYFKDGGWYVRVNRTYYKRMPCQFWDEDAGVWKLGHV